MNTHAQDGGFAVCRQSKLPFWRHADHLIREHVLPFFPHGCWNQFCFLVWNNRKVPCLALCDYEIQKRNCARAFITVARLGLGFLCTGCSHNFDFLLVEVLLNLSSLFWRRKVATSSTWQHLQRSNIFNTFREYESNWTLPARYKSRQEVQNVTWNAC